MSKTTKTIAALGMVAALGVAALPFGAFALAPTDREAGVDDGPEDTTLHNDHVNPSKCYRRGQASRHQSSVGLQRSPW